MIWIYRFEAESFPLTDENPSATVRHPSFKVMRADLVLRTQNRP